MFDKIDFFPCIWKVIPLHNLLEESLSINFDSVTLLKEALYDWISSCLPGKTDECTFTVKFKRLSTNVS